MKSISKLLDILETVIIFLLLCLFLYNCLGWASTIVYPPKTGMDFTEVKSALRSVWGTVAGLFILGMGIIVLLWWWKGVEKTPFFKGILSWFFVMFRIWLLLTGIIFIITGKYLPSIPYENIEGEIIEYPNGRFWGFFYSAAGYCVLFVLVVVQLIVSFVRLWIRRKKRSQKTEEIEILLNKQTR